MPNRIAIATLSLSDCSEFISAAAVSKRLHAGWVHPPTHRRAFRDRVRRMQPPTNYAFSIRRQGSGDLAGYADVTNVVRGGFLSAHLSYYAFEGHQRQGLMTEGLKQVIRFA